MRSGLFKLSVLAGFWLASAVAWSATLTLNVTGVDVQTGHLMIAVFDSAEAFDNDGEAVRGLKIKADAETVVVTIDELAPGAYAIKMYHDANDNGEMDTNMMGMPSESYGFSGNKGRFGPPPFAKAVVEVTEQGPNETTVKLR